MIRHAILLIGTAIACIATSAPSWLQYLPAGYQKHLALITAVSPRTAAYVTLGVLVAFVLVAGFLAWDEDAEARLKEQRERDESDFVGTIEALWPRSTEKESLLYIGIHLGNRGAASAVDNWRVSYRLKSTIADNPQRHELGAGDFSESAEAISELRGRNLYLDETKIGTLARRVGWLALRIDGFDAHFLACGDFEEFAVSFTDIAGKIYTMRKAPRMP